MVAPLEVTAYRSPGRDSTAGGRPWAGRPVTGTIRTPCCLARSSAAWVRGVICLAPLSSVPSRSSASSRIFFPMATASCLV